MSKVNVSSQEEDGILWINIGEPEASIKISSKVHQKFDEFFAAGALKIAVNMNEVDFIDSSFLGILVSAIKEAGGRGIKIVLYGVSSNVRAIFDLTRLDKLISILPNREAAIQALR